MSGTSRLGVHLAWVLLVAFVLCVPALYNGYPLLYSDTGTYLRTGYDLQLPWDRPLTYGLFLRLTSPSGTPWLPVAVQALLFAWITLAAFRQHARDAPPLVTGLLAMVALTWTTAIGVTASHLTPDVFLPIAILCMAVVLWHQRLRPSTVVGCSTLSMLAVVVSMAHLAIITGLVAGVALTWFALRRKRVLRGRRVAFAAAIVVLSWVALPLVHRLVGAGFRYPNGGPVFLMGRLTESGVLSDFLRVECPDHEWRICGFQDALPASADEFLWADSAFTRTGGPTAENIAEYSRVVRRALTTPRWALRIASAGVVAFLRQLVLCDSSWITPYADDSWLVVQEIRLRYPGYTNEFLRSRQRMGRLTTAGLDERQYVALTYKLALPRRCEVAGSWATAGWLFSWGCAGRRAG